DLVSCFCYYLVFSLFFVFFFSSRRRHTRFSRDWSSDVCSSDLSTGLTDLDKIIGGFQKGNSYILGGRPSMGKSAMMLKFALSAMYNNAVPVIFSLEMSKESLLRRWIATIGNINLFLANNPFELSTRKKEAWQQAINELSQKQFEIYDQPGQTIELIRAKTRQAQKEYD